MPTVGQIRYGITSWSTTMTCTVDGRDHFVSNQAMEAGLEAGHGQYTAICGHLAVAAALVVPPGPMCRDCEAALHRSTTASATSHRRRGLVARLLRRSLRRTDSRSTVAGSHRAGHA
ncbi:MAG: hypothetical protein ACRDTF_20825 [Pseudonocardiaceae bacterium]